MATGVTRTASIGITFFWSIAVFCAFALLAWLLFRFAGKPETYEDKRSAARVEKLEALRKENDAQLNGNYAWLDPQKGTVRLPVARGIELAIADLKNKPVAKSEVKVEVPYPYGLQPPPGADPAVAPVQDIGLNPSAVTAPVGPNMPAPELVKDPAATAPPTPTPAPAPGALPMASPGAAPGATASPGSRRSPAPGEVSPSRPGSAPTVPPAPAAPSGSGPLRGRDSTADSTPAGTPPSAAGPRVPPATSPKP